MPTSRRFPAPWTVEETAPCFIVRDHNKQALAFVYCEDDPGRRTAANLLTPCLQQGRTSEAVLAAVQKRREFPTRITQAVQVILYRGFARIFNNPGPLKAPWQFKLALRIPGIHRALGYAVGIGVRPEHVQNAKRQAGRGRSLVTAGIGLVAGVAVATVALRRMKKAPHRKPAAPTVVLTDHI